MLLEYLELGKIVSTHGVRGELRVQAWCDSYDFFSSFEKVYLGKEKKEYTVDASRPHGNVMLLTLSGICDLDAANALRNTIIYVKREDASLGDSKYFIAELIGCNVVDADDESIIYGKIKDVTNTGASDIWHIVKDGKTYLLPSIPDVVKSVEVEKDIARIKPLKGIFEGAEEIRED